MKENDDKVNSEVRLQTRELNTRMLLAGDVGATKTLLGLFEPQPVRPRTVVVKQFVTSDYEGLAEIVSAFRQDAAVRDATIDVASFGVAGPVVGDQARLTNVPWVVDAGEVARTFGIGRVHILNDLEAMAYAVPVLQASELHVLQPGDAVHGGNMALIAAGTGLGEALLHNVNGRFVPSASEGGHADFAARTERDITVMRDISRRAGRASVEEVVSGRGLANIYLVTHTDGACPAGASASPQDLPAAVTQAALERRCARCTETLEIFVEAYGAEAGNLALRTVSRAGLFIGGGIAPKILPALTDGRFMRAFLDKAPMGDLLARMPVSVILNREVGLLGAAVHAAAGF